MRKKSLLLIAVLVLIFVMVSVVFIACDKKENTPEPEPTPTPSPSPEPEPSPEPGPEPSPTPQPTPAEISETAMANFFTKLYAGNYVINASGKGTTTVYSPNYIYFEYGEGYTDPGVAYMTINNNETFQATYTGSLSNIKFVKNNANAIETASKLTPIYWIESLVHYKNIWEIFYNDLENPLKFSSHDDQLKDEVLSMNGYVNTLREFMGDVYLELNNINPTQAHIKATFTGGMPIPDPIDIVITFGNAKKSETIEEWIANPNLPDAKTKWDEEDKFVFKSLVFDENVIPFPTGASYALYFPYTFEEMLYYLDEVILRDGKAPAEAKNSYIDILLNNGFEAHVEDGVTSYRKQTSAEYKRYVSIEVEYEGGLNIFVSNYYDLEKYNKYNAVKALVSTKNYPNPVDLPATMTFKSAIDYTPQEIEALWYYIGYDLYLEVRLNYEDQSAAQTYVNDYIARLTQAPYGYVYNENEDFYKSTNDAENKRTGSFRWKFDGDEVVMLFKSEAYITPNVVRQYIADEAFPNPEFGTYTNLLEDKYSQCRDIAKYTDLMTNANYDHIYSIWLDFNSYDEIDTYLQAYVATFDENEWEGSTKANEYVMYNEDLNMTVSFRIEGNRLSMTFKPAENGVFYLKIQRYQEEGGIIRFGETGYYKPGKQIYVGASVFEGYVFAGWYEKTTGDPVLLTMEQEFFYEMPDDTSAMLIAKWYKDGEV